MDVASITSLLGGVKAATDIAKFIKDSDVSLEKAEAKLKLAELVSALADVKLQAAEVQQALVDKDERIRSLERAAEVRAALLWKQPCYWLESKEGVEEPYCQHCRDGTQRLVRLHDDGAGRYECRVCDKNFFTQERATREAEAFRSSSARRVISKGIY